MATLDDYKAYSPSWEGVGTQIAISLTISLACLSAHEALRTNRGFSHLFSARCDLKKNSSPPPSKKFLGWIFNVWRIEETFILHNIGLDAVLYLRFLKMLLQVVGLMVLIVMPILLPLDYINRVEDEGIKGTVQEFSITGVGKNTYKLWVHTIFNSCVATLIIYLIYRNTIEFVQLRRIHFLKEATDGNPRCRTVMVTNIPEPLCDEDLIRNHFEALGLGEVSCVQVLRYPAKLIDYCGRRKKALIELETAHISLAQNILKAIKSGSLKEDIFLQYDKGWEFQELKQYLKNSEAFTTTQCSSDSHRRLVLKQSIESNTMSVWDLLMRLDAALLEPFQPCHRKEITKGRTTYSIDHWFNKIKTLDQRIKLLRSGNTTLNHSGPTYHIIKTSTAFVTFANPASAQLCAQSIIHPSINCCQTYLAPEPKDIIWRNHALSRSSRISRKLIVNAVTWALIILWLIPVVFLLPLMSFDTLSKNYPSVEEFASTHPWAQSMIQTLVPATLLACFMSTLPHILYFVSTFEAWKTHSLCERAAAIRYYYFCIFNVLFLFLLGPAIFTVLLEAINNRYNIISEFADRIPRGAAFFINYVIFNTCYQFMELLCLCCPFLLSLGSSLIFNTPRERKRFEHAWSFPYYYYIPNHLLIFVIVITYATVNPVIIPVGGIYFLCTYFIFKNQFVYSYIKKYESNGRIWNLLVRFLTDGVIISQLTTASIIALKTEYTAVIPIIITLFATFYFKYYYRKTFHLRLKYVPLASLKKTEFPSRQSEDIFSAQSSRLASNIPTYNPHKDAIFDENISSSNVAMVSSINSGEALRPTISKPGPSHYLQTSVMGDEVENTNSRVYFAQAFSHPALVKPIPITMCLTKHPLCNRYNLQDGVIEVDLVLPTTSFNALRDFTYASCLSDSTAVGDATFKDYSDSDGIDSNKDFILNSSAYGSNFSLVDPDSRFDIPQSSSGQNMT